MVKIKRGGELEKIYQEGLYSMLEIIMNEQWLEKISDEEKGFLFFADKLKRLNKDKYNLMSEMYNAMTNIREEAYLITKKDVKNSLKFEIKRKKMKK